MDPENSKYHTLQSNASLNTHPNNKPNNFITQLAKPLELPGKWVIGLTEIHFPNRFKNHYDPALLSTPNDISILDSPADISTTADEALPETPTVLTDGYVVTPELPLEEAVLYIQLQLDSRPIISYSVNTIRRRLASKKESHLEIIEDMLEIDLHNRQNSPAGIGWSNEIGSYTIPDLVAFARSMLTKLGVVDYDRQELEKIGRVQSVDNVINDLWLADRQSKGFKTSPVNYLFILGTPPLRLDAAMENSIRLTRMLKRIFNHNKKKGPDSVHGNGLDDTLDPTRHQTALVKSYDYTMKLLTALGIRHLEVEELKNMVDTVSDSDSIVIAAKEINKRIQTEYAQRVAYDAYARRVKKCRTKPEYLMVYCTAADWQPVGDKGGPFLQYVPLPHDGRPTGRERYEKPDYKPVAKRFITQLEVDIRDERGCPVSFDGGHVLVTVHFRRVQ
jgi:hypothetical protein